MKRLYADLGLLIVALIWGVTFPVVKVAVESVSPFVFNSLRFFMACALFLPFVSLDGFRDGFKIGIATFLGYSFQTIGLQYTTATNAGFITSLYVVLAPNFGVFALRDEPEGCRGSQHHRGVGGVVSPHRL